ncbi:hypothetical protein J5X84_01750 [Streptosporangiaceae bacterium NEAU-GS5]|nr:hypothetical protein [Streptosporangiaceae bacterium NEAU-GS5]
MWRDPALTYRGALRILGHHDRPRIDKLDQILGGAIFGAGVAAGIASLTSPVLAPLAGFAAVWGWIDQKNEACGLVRKSLDAMTDRLQGTAGYDRHQLITAAHTTMVAAAFFEELREQLGKRAYKRLELTDEEHEMLVTGQWRQRRDDYYKLLYDAEVPAPSAVRGFTETLTDVHDWLATLAERTRALVQGLAAYEPAVGQVLDGIAGQAAERYQSHYLQTAALIPEFLVWAMLGEHAASRHLARTSREDILAVLDGQSSALTRLEGLLRVGGVTVTDDACAALHRANRGALEESIVPVTAMRHDEEITFPRVGRIYVTPAYRLAAHDASARPADDGWWAAQDVREDLDVLLAAHVCSAEATRLPMLLLGHPGAGKSLLTKVLAARLPPESYTVVRVPLRRVGAEAPVYEQIQDALDLATHGRIEWWRLAEQSRSTVRIVLLDGLDELLQAAAGHRSGYLKEVMDFQRREAEQGRPVVVVVTSRTLVADWVDVPRGTALVKLEEFSRPQIHAWIAAWHEANQAAIEAGKVRRMSPDIALSHADLAGQPLLLLMLALYSADPQSPPLDEEMSKAYLYDRLMENFARREVTKTAMSLSETAVAELAREHLWHLSVAALAMFNRGRQNVTDVELGSDLAALDTRETGTVNPAETGRGLIGRFFFVHAAEARLSEYEQTRHCYEFLHATFGEYLVAQLLVDTLSDLTVFAFGGRRQAREPDDGFLFTILSHQPLSIRGQIIAFAADLFAGKPKEERGRLLVVLENLVAWCRRRPGSERYASYRPLPLDRIRQVAAYSANLVLLRVWLATDAAVPLTRLWPDESDPAAHWRSTVHLWRSGLDDQGWQSILGYLALVGDTVRVHAGPDYGDAAYERLIGDAWGETRKRLGMAVLDGTLDAYPGDRWNDVMFRWLARGLMSGESPTMPPDADEPPTAPTRETLGLVDLFVKLRAWELGHDTLERLIVWRLRWARIHRPDPYALGMALWARPALILKVPALADPALYVAEDSASLLLFLARTQADERGQRALGALSAALEEIGHKPKSALSSQALFDVITAMRPLARPEGVEP